MARSATCESGTLRSAWPGGSAQPAVPTSTAVGARHTGDSLPGTVRYGAANLIGGPGARSAGAEALGASTFSLSAVKHKSVIFYADSQPASVTLTLSKLSPKARCPRPARNSHHKTSAHCPRYVKLGSFHTAIIRAATPCASRLASASHLAAI